ncbi:hypothetical protein ABMA28_017074 [Loxostege sticticalis]|uniref:Endonuclease n=1 Tax=Loxostege sticticalis TaxID=481309 RepID=A0ABD0T7B3_LOXSC
MDNIEKSQVSLHDQISKLLVNYKKTGKDRLTKGFIEARQEMADSFWQQFEQQHNTLLSSSSEYQGQSEYFLKDIYEQCFDCYLDLKTRMKEKLYELEDTKLQSVVSPPDNSILEQCPTSSQVKLPPIQLGTFSGDYRDWMSFRDLFKSLVHDNATISKVNKCQYLKSSLRGEAESLVKQVAVTEVNYDIIWDILNNRYNNKRSIVNTYIGKMLNAKRITTESSKHIRELLDVTTECLAVLKSIELPTDKWDDIVVYIIIQKLDPESHRLFEQRLESNDKLPTWNDLSQFLEFRFRTLEAVKQQKDHAHPRVLPPTKSFATEVRSQPKTFCGYCKEDSHYIFNCKGFCKLELSQRKEFIQNNHMCFNCLRKGHDVKSCLQSTNCRKCGRRHHSLLHGYIASTDELNQQKEPEIVNTHSTFAENSTKNHQVILATALVNVQSQRDQSQTHTLRALIDQGSQACLITEAARQFLGFKRTPVEGTVMGVGSGTSITKSTVEFNILSQSNQKQVIRVKAYVLKSLTSYIPQHPHSVDWPQLKDLELADPMFQKPGKIDIILGADVFAEILQEGVKTLKNNNNTLVAQQTTLGWLISGRHTNTANNRSSQVYIHHAKVEVDSMLQRFWELEETPEKRIMTKAETQCESHYDKTHLRLPDGRYQVRMPFKTNNPDIGESLTIAQKRFQLLENKFKRNPDLHEKYTEFMEDYIEQSHMEPIPNKEPKNKVCYIPHQAVINEQHLTTKLRVVFDSSAKTTNGKSLNDNLLIGPPLQNEIRDVTLRWRRHRVVLVGDIRQMYRRIQLDEHDRDFLRILWRSSPDQEIKHYRLTTVTYGTSCAPYLAIKTLRQLAEDERGNFDDQIIDTVLLDFYIDDLLTGEYTAERVVELKNELTRLLQSGGFTLHKWASNSTEIEGAEQSNRKILGINWNGHTDKFELKIELPPTTAEITKRTVLCDIAKIYDPAGWLAPVVILAKGMLQKLWIHKIEWDDYLPDVLLQEWLTFRNQLINMPTVELKRWIGFTDNNVKVELHGFSDASTIAYAAVVYCRVITLDGITVTIIEAKTRVAPVKQVSLPRLELCGAVLLAKLLNRVRLALSVPIQNTYAWTDAKIVLAWLQKSPSCWTTFVANRVTEITNLIDKERWFHVSSIENPADVASRGIAPVDLPDHHLWWQGPPWLRAHSTLPLEAASCVEPTNLEEKVLVKVNTVHKISEKCDTSGNERDTDIFNRYSSLSKLVRVIAIVFRFYNCLKHKVNTKSVLNCPKYLTTIDLKNSLYKLIKKSQNDNLNKVINMVKSKNVNKKCKNFNKLRKLHPFLDEQDVLRVKGRICNSSLDFDIKHPVILTKNCKLSYLIVRDAHHKTLHGGIQLMLNFIRSKYHIIGVKYLIKQIIRECVSCVRHSGKSNIQLMGDLPKHRVVPQRPFSISGVDLAGPVTLKLFNGRGSNRTQKGYIVLFICTAVKAVHLELVTSLSSEAFLAAFRRFTARRGHCHKLISDCGTNFVGASKDLKDLHDNCLKNLPPEIAETLAQNGTHWTFNPAGAPHMGGLWEANVKSVKRHLCRVLNDTKLTFEEYYTLLCQIESCLNSRPLTPLNDESDLALTPGHFLIGEAPNIVSEGDLTEIKVPYLQRWLYLQQKLQYFWKRWSQEYLVTLQNRHKWTGVQKNISVNDIVLVKDERLPPAKWLIGRVLETHAGADGLIRVVSVKCKSTVIKRPIHKLCLLPVDSPDL